MPTQPLAGGNNIVLSPIVDPHTGVMTFAWTKWFQDAQQRLQNALDLLGQFIGTIGASATVQGRPGTLVSAIQNLDSSGRLSATALNGTVTPGQIPTPTISTIGGVQANNPVAHQWVNSISASGVPQLSQPGYGDIAGAPTPPANTAAVSHEWLNSYNSASGVFSQSQPAFSDISGQITIAQLPASGFSGSVTLAKITVGGTNGSLTVTNGIITAVVNPT